ncbi:MAG: nitroreductase family protein [Thermodesulfovibrionales bacterium]|nr:nitroreductase family protein [Thermodesulfovibrionales bacterium]
MHLVLDVIKNRRSINFFDPHKEISEDILKSLLEIANLAPSSFNLQPWKVIIVRDPNRKRILRKCAFDQPKVEEASVVLIIIADPLAIEENLERVFSSWENLGYMKPEMRDTYKAMVYQLEGEPDSLKRKFFAIKNAALFAMNLMIAARGFGLETHPMDGFDEACIKREFNIPEDKIIPMLIAIGYLKEGVELLPRAFRREIKEFVKSEKYS